MSIVATLDIDIVEADGLPRPASGHQRPSCVLTVAGRDAVQTSAPKKSDAPVWKQQFHFADLELEELVVRFGLVVVDRSREIGQADVEQPLDGSAGQRIDAWADLSDGGRVHFVVSVVEIELPPSAEPETHPEPPAEAPEEEEPQEEVEEPQQEIETVDESDQTEEAVTPRTRQLRTKLQNDKQQPHEIEQKARAAATRKYREFLKKRTPALLENAAIARRFREENEQEEAPAARTPE
jgi:hypothetical protein